MNLLKLNTVDCDFDASKGILKCRSGVGNYPQVVEVTSHHTGKVVRFVRDEELAIANEGWDGEECWYKPQEILPRVDYLVLFAHL